MDQPISGFLDTSFTDWNGNGNALASGSSSSTASPADITQDCNTPSIAVDEADEHVKDGQPKIRNCSGCRLRRIKCERIPGQKDCIKCVQKGIACEEMPRKAKKLAPNRSGKRIEAARALFGPSQAGNEDQSLSLVPSSLPARLNHLHLQGEVASSLIDDYLTHFSTRVAVVDGTAFRSNFELVGRQISHLDEQSQVLCSVIMSVSARYTSNPLFAGDGAPSIEELRDPAKVGADLSVYGFKREAACQALVEQTIALIDQKGTMRKPSPESVAILVLLDGLLQDRSGTDELSRPYMAALVSHAKSLCEEDTPPEIRSRVQSKALGWSPFVRDCLSAAATGRSPSYTEDDMLALRGGKAVPAPLRSVLRRNVAKNVDGFWEFIGSYLHTIVMSARGIASKLTGLSARRAIRVDESFVHEFIENMALCQTASNQMEERIATSGISTARLEFGGDILNIVRGLRIARASLIFQVYRVLGQRLAAKEGDTSFTPTMQLADQVNGTWPSLNGPGKNDTEYWSRLATHFEDLNDLMFEACRDICNVIKVTLQSNGPLSIGQWNDGRGAGLLFTRLPIWLPVLLNAKVAEEGGTKPDWTYATQIDDLTWVLKALYAIGWAYESMARPSAWLRVELDTITRRRDLYYSNAALASTPTFPTPSLSPFVDELSYNQAFASTPSFPPINMAPLPDFGVNGDPFQMPEGVPDLDFQSLLDSLGVPQMQQY